MLTPFGVIDPEQLSQGGCLDLLIGLERLAAWTAAQQARVIARLAARPEPVPAATHHDAEAREFVREEIACALQWSANLARDRTCRGIGCHRQARRCELDHVQDWQTGGATSAANLIPSCGRDHHLKHDAGWNVHRHPDGTISWTSPHGRTYDKPPETYPIDTTGSTVSTDADPPF
ncbi:MAG: HNH endonuclease signature motif containing protein [Jatrophihabitantaceae bacterium]